MGNQKINYGLVGYGLMGWALSVELQLSPLLRGRTKLVAAFDPDPKNQAKISKRNHVKPAQNFEDLLNTPDLNALLISSPPQYHADQVVAGLEAGLHVFSEVPMALSEADVERIILAEDRSGKKYQFGENYAFFSEVLYAGSLVSTGKIGPAVYAESEYLHDVTYRWRQGYQGGPETPRINSWYSLFEPMEYAHTIGPAQVALGGIKSPMPFIEVKSYITSNGGFQGDPICRPSGAFQVALFRSKTNAIAKCANAFIIAREHLRLSASNPICPEPEYRSTNVLPSRFSPMIEKSAPLTFCGVISASLNLLTLKGMIFPFINPEIILIVPFTIPPLSTSAHR